MREREREMDTNDDDEALQDDEQGRPAKPQAESGSKFELGASLLLRPHPIFLVDNMDGRWCCFLTAHTCYTARTAPQAQLCSRCLADPPVTSVAFTSPCLHPYTVN